ncbi:hypothetical protein Q9L58_006874 [Maublancomyces gigas]|uniref:Fungal N-terminal domain-containing protein n=1 Tax=Discina gigas TaxID=1032678 RepID=A0ABR3GE21_9PEZI
MTSSFSPTEFLHTSDRAWNLYRHCYTVAQTATRKLDILLPGLTTLSQSIQHLQEECDDPTSTLATSGQAWIYAVKGIVRHAETTLVNIERYANRCERLGDPSRAMRSQKWDLCKAAFDGRKMKKLERQLVFQDGMVKVLLFSSNMNSLQLFTASNVLLESRCIRINDLITQAGPSFPQPTTLLLRGVFMTNAEPEQKEWASIEIDEWLQSQSLLAPGPARQGYVDVVKAGWIFTSIIRCHPRLVILDPGSRVEAEALAETIIQQLEEIDATGIVKPSCEELQLCDLRIWGTERK